FADYLALSGHMDLREEYLRRVCAESLIFTLRRYDFVLGDLAARLNKKVNPIRFVGADVPIISDRYQGLFDSLVHLFRNTVDHGIEPPDFRQRAGKDEHGTVEIKMEVIKKSPNESWLRLAVQDDGAGVDVDCLRKRLIVQYPDGHWDKRNAREVLDSLLTCNISSREKATVYSGRGVGICTVYAEVAKLGGVMTLNSTPGQGTCVTVEVPYVLEFRKN
ncbi:MAG: ATP-binding protein, partial [Bdellovibrionales bacterium]